MAQVKGEFDVKRTPEGGVDLGGGNVAGHFRFDKELHGALDAIGVVHMLAVGTQVDGSAAYVAIERISGTLDGLTGSFLTQHNGTLDRGTPSLSVTVVPDSGTDELTGLSGRIVIDIVEGSITTRSITRSARTGDGSRGEQNVTSGYQPPHRVRAPLMLCTRSVSTSGRAASEPYDA